MSNEILIKIRSTSDRGGFKDVKQDLRDVETASDKAGNAVAELDKGLAAVGSRKVKVDVEIPRDAFGRFLPKGERVKVGVEPDAGSGVSFMSKFAGLAAGAAGPASKLLGNHIGITVGAAAGVAAAPVLASAIGSALSAGAGAGVIGAGIALAIKSDKSLQAVGKQVGQDFMENMGAEAKVFAGPIRESFDILEDAGSRVSQKWGKAFDSMADDVVPFVEDIVSGAERISDAFTNVAKGSGAEALEGLGDTWKLLADGVGDFVETVADGGPEAANNLRLVGGATADLLRYTGQTLDSLNKLSNNPWVTGPLIPALRDHYVEAADATGKFSRHTQGSAVAMENAAAAARGEREALEGLSAELKAQSDPVFAIIKAQNDLKDAQDETAKATKEHGANSDEAEEALQKQALAALSLESNIGKLGDAFDGKMTPAMRATLRAAGVTAPAIDRLERQFKEAKTAGDRFAKNYPASVRVNGVPKARADLRAVAAIANSIDGKTVDIAMRITGSTSVSRTLHGIKKQYAFAHGGIRGAADGGMRSGLTLVGEEGPELAEIAPGGRVWSNPDTQRMLAGAGGGGSSGPIVVQVMLDGRQVAEAIVEPTRELVGRQGNGSAQQFFGRPGVA